jgi:hypothetical protein
MDLSQFVVPGVIVIMSAFAAVLLAVTLINHEKPRQ